MLNKLILVSVGIALALLLPGGPLGLASSTSTSGPLNVGPALAPGVANESPPILVSSGVPSPTSGPLLPETASASINVTDFTNARNLPASFWGVNVAAAQPFTSKDAANIAATPVTYIRFPGGLLGEEFNYTSGVLTNLNGGTTNATTSIHQFISACRSIHCKAILQLPAEIDEPQTAAYYASFVVNPLHFKPAYWEVGNAVQSWSHFDTPWSAWKKNAPTHVNATSFAEELEKYV